MFEFLKSSNLSDKAIALYHELYNKSPLTLNEINLLKPDYSKKETIEVINELFQEIIAIMKIKPQFIVVLGGDDFSESSSTSFIYISFLKYFFYPFFLKFFS